MLKRCGLSYNPPEYKKSVPLYPCPTHKGTQGRADGQVVNGTEPGTGEKLAPGFAVPRFLCLTELGHPAVTFLTGVRTRMKKPVLPDILMLSFDEKRSLTKMFSHNMLKTNRCDHYVARSFVVL